MELWGQRKIMPRVEKPQGRRKRRGCAGRKRDTHYNTARGLVSLDEASVDTEATPH